MSWLDYAYNKHSQNGEDGIVERLLTLLQEDPSVTLTKWVCEFGAWDGKHLSNTFKLVEEQGWNAVYIEGDEAKFADLLVTAEQYPKITPIKQMLQASAGDTSLDAVLQKTPIPYDFDLLSIDIDSWDLQIWRSLLNYRPKVVIIEINSSLPPGVYQEHIPDGSQGCSFSSAIEVARHKHYTYVCHTGNVFFIVDELAHIIPPTLDPATTFRSNWVV